MEPMDNPRPIKESELPNLVAAGAIRSVCIERVPGADDGRRLGADAWAVRLRLGMQEAVIGSHHRAVRTWGSLDTLAAWLQRQGIGHWEVRVK